MYKKLNLPFSIYEVDLLNASREDLVKISSDMKLSLNLEEMEVIREYFLEKKRNPRDIELQTLAQTWSEHCRHKTFRGVILDVKGEVLVEDMLKNKIARATRELNFSWVYSFLEDNAGIVDFTGDYGIAVKVETHNHPSAIDPFGGAATGVGGVIRDILGVWAKPIASIDVLCFGPLDYPYNKLPRGVKHPKYLVRGVVSGIGHYGNNFGVPTVAGTVYFDEGYVGNIAVYVGCVGLLPKSKYIRRIKPGDYIVVVGNRTGRDGIQGATFASAELSEESEVTSRPAVQIPDPIEEEKLKRAILRVRDEELASGITDLGGGGLAVGVSELAGRISGGAVVWLDKLHLREEGMAPWEIWISESQERMLLGVPRNCIEGFTKILEEEEVEYSVIGVFTGEDSVKVYFKGCLILDLNTEFLLNPPRTIRRACWKPPKLEEPEIPLPEDLNSELLRLLASPNIASKESIIRTYDHEVQGNTVLKPICGAYGGPSDAVVIKPLEGSWKGVVLSVGLKPRYSMIDPYWMAASSIEEAIRNNVSVGGRRVALLDNFTWGSPEKPDRLGGLVRAVDACYYFAKAFETPFISGKDSLYNESPLGPILSTLLITGIGVIPDVRKVITLELKEPGNPIYLLGVTRRELGGSEYYRVKGFIGASIPKVYVEESKRTIKLLVEAIDRGVIKACHDLSEGGLGVSIAEMVLSSRCGAEIFLEEVLRTNVEREDYILFSESNGRFLVEVDKSRASEFEELVEEFKAPSAKIGRVTSHNHLYIYGLHSREDKVIELPGETIRKVWREGLRW